MKNPGIVPITTKDGAICSPLLYINSFFSDTEIQSYVDNLMTSLNNTTP